jgi:hypothetical protein
MHQKNLTDLLSDAFKNPFETTDVVKEKMEGLSVKNIADVSDRAIVDNLRIPTPEELTAIRQWAIDYKNQNKKASKR